MSHNKAQLEVDIKSLLDDMVSRTGDPDQARVDFASQLAAIIDKYTVSVIEETQEGGSGGNVQDVQEVLSVTGLNTDNSNPLKPVVRISVDGVTIIGQGTPASPLIAAFLAWVLSVTDDGNGVVSIDNTDPQNPIINFNGVNVDGTTIGGNGTSGSPLYVIDPTYTVSTTDATVTTIQTIPIPTNTGLLIRTHIRSRKTGGAGVGTTGDVNGYIRSVKVKNVAGVVTMGTIGTDYTSEDIAPFNVSFAVSGTDILVQVTGSANNNVDWTAKTKLY